MRTRMQLLIIVVLLAVIAMLVVCAVRLSGQMGMQESKEGTGNSTEYASEELAAMDEPNGDYMDRYGIPEEVFVKLNIADNVASSLDFDYMNSLKTYTVQPYYSENELLELLLPVLCDSSDDYTVTKQDYATSSDGIYVGWGNYYYYKNSLNQTFLEGSTYSARYVRRDTGIKVGEDEQTTFIQNMINEYHLGFWEDGKPLLSVSMSNNSSLSTNSYVLELSVDGITVDNDLWGNMDNADADGVKYTGWAVSKFEFDKSDGGLREIDWMYSGDITGNENLRLSYGGIDDISAKIENAIGAVSNDTEGIACVYDISGAYLAYSVGNCDDGTYMLTPWLVLTGTEGYYVFDYNDIWQSQNIHIVLNLNTGEAYVNNVS